MKVTSNVLVFGLVAVLTIGGALIAVVFVLGGPDQVVEGRVAIISSTIGPAVGVFILLLQQGHMSEQVAETKKLVNGHLDKHVGHTDEEVKRLVREQLAGMQSAAAPLVPKDEPTPPKEGA